MKSLFFAIILFFIFLICTPNLVKSACPGGACPVSITTTTKATTTTKDSHHHDRPEESSTTTTVSTASSTQSSNNYCPPDYCSKSLDNGHCPPPCKDKGTGKKRYCCCVKESLEEIDKRIETNKMLDTDEPIGFIQRCICKEFSSPCSNDSECMQFAVDPFEKAIYPEVCGNGIKIPEKLNSGPTTPLTSSNPVIGSYTFETDLSKFIKIFLPQGFFVNNSTFSFDKETKPFSLLASFIINLSLRLSGIILFIILVYSGIMYSLSGGDPKKKQEAQKRIIEAIIGFFLLFGFYIILNTINPEILRPKSVKIFFDKNNLLIVKILNKIKII